MPDPSDFLADVEAAQLRPGSKCSWCLFLEGLEPAFAAQVRAAIVNPRISDSAVVATLRGPKYNRTDTPSAENLGRHRREHERSAAA